MGTYREAALVEAESALVLKEDRRVFKDAGVVVEGKSMVSPPGKTVT